MQGLLVALSIYVLWNELDLIAPCDAVEVLVIETNDNPRLSAGLSTMMPVISGLDLRRIRLLIWVNSQTIGRAPLPLQLGGLLEPHVAGAETKAET